MVFETLRQRGWCLEDTDELKAIIAIQSAVADEPSKVLHSVESELLNSDLRSIGAKSLPQPSLLRNASSVLHGPKVLQAIPSIQTIGLLNFNLFFCCNSLSDNCLRLCWVLADNFGEGYI